MTSLEDILIAAQSLPSSERAKLLAALWDKVSPDDWIPPSADWIAEASRRSDEFDAGNMSGADWTEVRQRARRKAGIDG